MRWSALYTKEWNEAVVWVAHSWADEGLMQECHGGSVAEDGRG